MVEPRHSRGFVANDSPVRRTRAQPLRAREDGGPPHSASAFAALLKRVAVAPPSTRRRRLPRASRRHNSRRLDPRRYDGRGRGGPLSAAGLYTPGSAPSCGGADEKMPEIFAKLLSTLSERIAHRTLPSRPVAETRAKSSGQPSEGLTTGYPRGGEKNLSRALRRSAAVLSSAGLKGGEKDRACCGGGLRGRTRSATVVATTPPGLQLYCMAQSFPDLPQLGGAVEGSWTG